MKKKNGFIPISKFYYINLCELFVDKTKPEILDSHTTEFWMSRDNSHSPRFSLCIPNYTGSQIISQKIL